MILSLVVLCVIACTKDDDGVTMKPDRLAGTYWKQTQVVHYEYKDGKLTDTFRKNFDGSMSGGAGPTVLAFADDNTLVEYHVMGPTGLLPDTYYKSRKFDYTPGSKLFVVCDPDREANRKTLETFTSDRIVWNSSIETTKDGVTYRTKTREIYHRYRPTDEWRRQAAQYPDYDRIDWSAVNK